MHATIIDAEATNGDERPSLRPAGRGKTAEAIQAWIVRNLEEALELEPGELKVDEQFDTYGLDSTEAVNLMSALEDWLGRELPPNLVYQHPTVGQLAQHLAEG